MNKKTTSNRLMALLLSLIMVLGMLPMTAFAVPAATATEIFTKVTDQSDVTEGEYLFVSKVGEQYYALQMLEVPAGTELWNVDTSILPAVPVTLNADGNIEDKNNASIMKFLFNEEWEQIGWAQSYPLFCISTMIGSQRVSFESSYIYENNEGGKTKYGHAVTVNDTNGEALIASNYDIQWNELDVQKFRMYSIGGEYYFTVNTAANLANNNYYDGTDEVSAPHIVDKNADDSLKEYPVYLYKRFPLVTNGGVTYSVLPAYSEVSFDASVPAEFKDATAGKNNDVKGLIDAVNDGVLESMIASATELDSSKVITAEAFVKANVKSYDKTAGTLEIDITPYARLSDGTNSKEVKITDSMLNGDKIKVSIYTGDIEPKQIIHNKQDGTKEYFYDSYEYWDDDTKQKFEQRGSIAHFEVTEFSSFTVLTTPEKGVTVAEPPAKVAPGFYAKIYYRLEGGLTKEEVAWSVSGGSKIGTKMEDTSYDSDIPGYDAATYVNAAGTEAVGTKLTVTAKSLDGIKTYATFDVDVVEPIYVFGVYIEGVTRPIDGEYPTVEGITVSTGAKLLDVYWMDSDDQKLDPYDTFVAGNTYKLHIYFQAADGYLFGSSGLINPSVGGDTISDDECEYRTSLFWEGNAIFTCSTPTSNIKVCSKDIFDGDYIGTDGNKITGAVPTDNYTHLSGNTLTLKNFTYSGSDDYAIFALQSLNIVLEGTNTLSAKCGIAVINNDLSISGSGSLIATGTADSGIMVPTTNNSITITGATVSAIGSTGYYGIFANNTILINNSTVTASGNIGILAANGITIQGVSVVNASGTDLGIVLSNSTNKVSISGGTVTSYGETGKALVGTLDTSGYTCCDILAGESEATLATGSYTNQKCLKVRPAATAHTISFTPVTDVTFTAIKEGASDTPITEAAVGTKVRIMTTGYPASMVFQGWSAYPAVTFDNSAVPNTTFIMPDCDVTITATFTAATPLTGTLTLNNTTPKVSDTLTATADTNNVGDMFYEWYRNDTRIDSACGYAQNTYTVTSEDIGKVIKCVASGTGSIDGSVEASTAAVVAVPTEYGITVTDGIASVGAGTVVTKTTTGTTVTITANPAPTGQEFDKWEVISGVVTLDDATSATTTFTMPANPVSVKATYKTHVHTGGTATCTALAICDVCNQPYGDLAAHDYSVHQHDGTQHWNKCSKCDATDTKADHIGGEWQHDETDHWKDCTVVGCGTIVATKAAHSFGADNTCDICGYEKPTTPAPTLLKGNNGKFVKGGKDGLAFRSSAEYSDFVSVSVDGTVIGSDKYTVKSGSTIAILKADYLDTLSTGNHTLTITSNTGDVTANFTIETQPTTDAPTTPGTDEPTSPQTGDTSNMFLWIALMFVSGIALTGTIVFVQKKESVR